MIIRKIPRNPSDYFVVDSETSMILHKNGFFPRFMSMDGKKYYYTKKDDVQHFIRQNNLTVLD